MPPELIQAGSTGRIYQASPDEVARLSHFRTKTGKLQRALLALLTEHEQDDAIPTSARFLFYELEQRGVIPKHYVDGQGNKRARQPGGDIADALTHLRQHGLVPWDWLEDEVRHLSRWSYAASVAEYVTRSIDHAKLDLWAGEAPPLILCESRAVAGPESPAFGVDGELAVGPVYDARTGLLAPTTAGPARPRNPTCRSGSGTRTPGPGFRYRWLRPSSLRTNSNGIR